MKQKGFGDTIKTISDSFGIKQCGGCKKRQKALNKAIPYRMPSFDLKGLIKRIKDNG